MSSDNATQENKAPEAKIKDDINYLSRLDKDKSKSSSKSSHRSTKVMRGLKTSSSSSAAAAAAPTADAKEPESDQEEQQEMVDQEQHSQQLVRQELTSAMSQAASRIGENYTNDSDSTQALHASMKGPALEHPHQSLPGVQTSNNNENESNNSLSSKSQDISITPFLQSYQRTMMRSRQSQEALQQWDVNMGLRRSDCRTMTLTNSSRSYILSIIRQWCAPPSDGGVSVEAGGGAVPFVANSAADSGEAAAVATATPNSNEGTDGKDGDLKDSRNNVADSPRDFPPGSASSYVLDIKRDSTFPERVRYIVA